MKDFNRVAIMTEQDLVNRGFMFEYIQENFPYSGWVPVGYAVMDAFEKTFGDIKAPAGIVREKREIFITAIQEELTARLGAPMAGHKAFIDLTEKIREVLQPQSTEIFRNKERRGPQEIDPAMLPAILGSEYLGDPITLKQAFESIQDMGRVLKIPFTKVLNAIKNFKSPHP